MSQPLQQIRLYRLSSCKSEVPESLFTPSPFLGTPLEYVNVDAALLTGILYDSLAAQGLNPGAAGLALDTALTSLAANPFATVGYIQANIQDQLISQGLNPIAAFNLANEAVGAIFQGTRSNAAAKMTRVEDRNRVPTQAKNHRLSTRISTTWNAVLCTSQPANMNG